MALKVKIHPPFPAVSFYTHGAMQALHSGHNELFDVPKHTLVSPDSESLFAPAAIQLVLDTIL